MKKVLLALVVIVGTLAAVRSDAGYQLNNFSGCTRNSDGSGYCYGDFLSVRNTANTSDFAYFTINSTTNTCFFNMSTGGSGSGQYGSCSFSAAQASLCPIALANKGGFRVDFDNAGHCTYMSFQNGSEYSNF
jgi:hypothetical protein